MKKVLFATTALVATAGVAAADVTVSGSAEMGIAGADGVDATFFQSVDVRFTLSGEADNGLSFGAVIDLDDASDRAGTTGIGDINDAFADFSVFIAGDFGRLTMGDTDGAMDWALTEAGNMGNAGSIADNETGHSGYMGSYLDGAYQGQVLRYEYTIGDFGIAASVETTDGRDAGYAIGARYNLDLGAGSLALGLAYQTATFQESGGDLAIASIDITDYVAPIADMLVDVDAIGASVVYSGNGFTAGVVYTTYDADYVVGGTPQTGEMEHIGVGLGYTFDAITVSGNWGRFDGSFFPGQIIDEEGYGLAASYDFGGGLSAHVGFGRSEVGGTSAAAGTTDNWSLGLAMSF